MASKPPILAQGTVIKMTKLEHNDITKTPTASALVDLQCETKTIGYTGGQADETDITTLCSDAKEVMLGATDPGEMSWTGHYLPQDEAYKALIAASNDRKQRMFIVIFADGSTFKAIGMIKQRSWSANVGEVVTSDITIRLSGAIDESEVATPTPTPGP